MEHLGLIRKIAWSFHYTTGIDFDDLFSEASLAYCEGLSKFDPERGKITTFMYTHIQNHLRNYLQKNYTKQPNLISIDVVRVDHFSESTDLFDRLTPAAMEIARMLLSNPKPYAYTKPNAAKCRMAKVMLNKGWDMAKIWVGISELKQALSYNH